MAINSGVPKVFEDGAQARVRQYLLGTVYLSGVSSKVLYGLLALSKMLPLGWYLASFLLVVGGERADDGHIRNAKTSC